MKLKYLFLILMIGFIFSCGDPEDECDILELTYNNDIGAIIDNSCATAGCHGAASAATFPMSTYAETNTAVGFGKIVGAISHTDGFSAMPKGGTKLDDCTISKITAWIADGAPE